MLTPDQLAELETRIERDIAQLRASAAASEAERAAVPPDKAVGRLSRLDAMQMQDVARRAQLRREERIFLLEAAMDRIEAGIYGACQSCGQPIAWLRLEAQPESPHCSRCAS